MSAAIQFPSMFRPSKKTRNAAADEQIAAHMAPVHHTYHGHRRASFCTQDIDELTELRARRRELMSLSHKAARSSLTFQNERLKERISVHRCRWQRTAASCSRSLARLLQRVGLSGSRLTVQVTEHQSSRHLLRGDGLPHASHLILSQTTQRPRLCGPVQTAPSRGRF